MASTTTKLLHLRPKLKRFPPPPKPFSSSSSSSSSNPNTENSPHQTPNTENTPTPSPKPKPFSFSSIANNNNNNTQDPSSKSSSSSSFDEIRKNLAEFRLRAGAVAPSPPTTSPPSFQQLYKNTLNNINNNNNADFNPNRKLPTTGKFGFDAIRANLSKLKENGGGGKLSDPLSLSRLKDSLQMRPGMGNDVKGGGGVGMVIGGGTGNLPSSIFGKEMMMRDKEGGGEKEGTGMEFLRSYSPGDLGAKLKMLKPVKKKEEEKGSFSLQELKDRLDKVRENDEKETKLMDASGLGDLKRCLEQMKHDGDKKAKKTIIQRFEVLEHLGGTPSFMLHPPKEHLVEKFFHPDHMSSGEKMKLELQKVRDEFKMSESDCGSARVQVAQLTTKIKHLSTVLHKKDKHSRKGLQEMVQKRKKLLKYLRKTDWESYCLVLSKLGLRDNPDYKF